MNFQPSAMMTSMNTDSMDMITLMIIGMRKEDNPRLFDSVYRQLFGTDYEESDKSRFDFSDNDSDMF